MAFPETSEPEAAAETSYSYELTKPIGSGSFGQVYGCTDLRTGEELACKVIPPEVLSNEHAIEAVRREVGIMQKLSGKNKGIVRLQEVGQDHQGSVHMVMELCHGGDLFDMLKAHGRLPEAAARLVFRQIASALNVCHVMGVVHRDIKPENILLDSCPLELYEMVSTKCVAPCVQAKLADFGLALELAHGCRTSGFVGSPQYAAPEVVQGALYGRKADIWSLGVVLYAMVSGRLPFASKAADSDDLARAICSGKVSFSSSCWSEISEEAKDLIRWMMTVDEERRPSSSDVLFHPWVLGRHGVRRHSSRQKLQPLAMMEPVCV